MFVCSTEVGLLLPTDVVCIARLFTFPFECFHVIRFASVVQQHRAILLSLSLPMLARSDEPVVGRYRYTFMWNVTSTKYCANASPRISN